jgi:DNA invertase Pin-like site-specific DNA recombinase
MEGFWPMVAEPGPNFRWGVVLRKSKLKRTVNQYGEVELVAESMDHQELEVVSHIRDNNMGVIVETYREVASGWSPTAKRPRYKHALVDLSSGWIDGIAVLAVDRLTRRTNQVRPILNALEEMGGRLFALWDELDTAYNDPEHNTELRLHELVERAERKRGERLSATSSSPSIAPARGFTMPPTTGPMGIQRTAASLWTKRRKCCSRRRRQSSKARQ